MLLLVGSTAFPSPKRAFPVLENPGLEKPELGSPKLAYPELENPAQLNTYILNTKQSNKDLLNTHSFCQSEGQNELTRENHFAK